MKKNIISEIKKRKLIINISNKKKIIKKIKKKKIKLYCGFDPTYKSLHLGHLIPLITLKRFKKYGYKIIILIGKTTSEIGDPSFKKKKRKKLSKKKIIYFAKKIKKQIKKILNINNKNILILSNDLWFKKMKILYFLKNISIHFNIKNMLNKEAIKKRNIKNKIGISFTEMSYNILQSYDFLYLYKNFNINLQIGGSDQWGNIISGINLIKKIHNKEVFGITLPLMTKKNGSKFGKTENKTLWLDKKITTPYEFYQFWLNINDEQTFLFLKQLTFLSIKKIKYIIKTKNIKEIKKILANKITKIIHGKKELKNSILASNFFFNKKNIYNKKILKKIFKIKIPKFKLKNKKKNLKEILIILNITKTKSQSHNLITNKSIYINKKIILETNYNIKKKDKLFNKYTIINKGKKNFFLIKWI